MRFQLGCAPVLALAAILFAGCVRAKGGSANTRGLEAEEEPGADSGSPPYSYANPNPGSPALFVRLGGVDGIRTVVDELVSRLAADPRIQQFFVDTDFRRFKGALVIELCQLSGGPYRSRGRSMRLLHRGLHIHSAHFEAFMEDARGALKAAQVGERERYELLSILRSLKPQIVEPAT